MQTALEIGSRHSGNLADFYQDDDAESDAPLSLLDRVQLYLFMHRGSRTLTTVGTILLAVLFAGIFCLAVYTTNPLVELWR